MRGRMRSGSFWMWQEPNLLGRRPNNMPRVCLSVSRPLQHFHCEVMTLKDFRFYKLELSSEIKPFKCSDVDLNGFLVDDAKNYFREMLASTYILED